MIARSYSGAMGALSRVYTIPPDEGGNVFVTYQWLVKWCMLYFAIDCMGISVFLHFRPVRLYASTVMIHMARILQLL
jgi:hypothetical protein